MREKKATNIVGQRIRYFRRIKGLTQAELAEKINKTVEMICHVENGTASTKLSTLEDIAEVLDIDIYRLFTESKDFNYLNISGKLLDIFLDLEEADNETINAVALLVHKSVAK